MPCLPACLAICGLPLSLGVAKPGKPGSPVVPIHFLRSASQVQCELSSGGGGVGGNGDQESGPQSDVHLT